jgi:GNAT superfamily N-acetyltransferase
VLRPARAGDAAALTDLALRAKAVWGYDAAFMAGCRAELTITPAQIAERPTWLVEAGGEVVGFYQLRLAGACAEVAQLFVDPGRLRGGVGRQLWADLEARARAAGCRRLEVDSDPHAEGFYRAMGMQACGTRPSGSIPRRRLPHLRKDL